MIVWHIVPGGEPGVHPEHYLTEECWCEPNAVDEHPIMGGKRFVYHQPEPWPG